jgi:hypothetical protein
MTGSPALEEEVRSRVSWLESYYPGIVGCRVLLEIPHRHRRHGRSLHVRIERALPGEDAARRHRGDIKTRAAAS